MQNTNHTMTSSSEAILADSEARASTRYALILNAELSSGLAINIAVHLATQLGAACPQIAGAAVVDADGVRHSGLPIAPNIILAAPPETVRACLNHARELAAEGSEGGVPIVVLDYPDQGRTTSTDHAYREAIAVAEEASLVYLAFLVYGDRRTVGKITRKLTLWSG